MRILKTPNSEAINMDTIVRLYVLDVNSRDAHEDFIEDLVGAEVVSVIAELLTGTRIELTFFDPSEEALAHKVLDRLSDVLADHLEHPSFDLGAYSDVLRMTSNA